MTTKQDLLRAHLENDKKRLSEQLEQIRNGNYDEDRREGSPFGKREEEASETAEFENRLAMERRILDQMAEVDYALEKFENGKYGICEECGKKINPERLEIVPHAKYCLKCKAKMGKNIKGR